MQVLALILEMGGLKYSVKPYEQPVQWGHNKAANDTNTCAWTGIVGWRRFLVHL